MNACSHPARQDNNGDSGRDIRLWSRSRLEAFGENRRRTFGDEVCSMLHLLPKNEQKETYTNFVHESGRVASETGFWLFGSRGASKIDESRVTSVLVTVVAKDCGWPGYLMSGREAQKGMCGGPKRTTTRRKVHDSGGRAHLVTFSCYRRRRLLDDDRAKRIVIHFLDEELKKAGGSCIGFLIMPDHGHALLHFRDSGIISRFIQQWKRKSSNRLKKFLNEHLRAYVSAVDQGEPMWQVGILRFQGFLH